MSLEVESNVSFFGSETEANETMETEKVNIKFGTHDADEPVKGEVNHSAVSNLPKDAVDEWPEPKQIHSFYIVRYRAFEDQNLRAKLDAADNELQKKNRARLEIVEKLRAKRVPIPKKIQVFMWLMALGKVPTCDVLQKSFPNVYLSPNWCVLCNSNSESLNHCFLQCPFAFSLWCRALDELEQQRITPHSFNDLLLADFGGRLSSKGMVLWGILVPAVCWSVWAKRNKRIFENTSNSMDEVWGRIKYLVASWAIDHRNFRSLFVSDLARNWSVAL